MTGKPTDNDVFDVDPGAPGRDSVTSPFDDFADDDFTEAAQTATNVPSRDARYDEIARELSQMDAAIEADYSPSEQAEPDWQDDIFAPQSVASDLHSLEDLALDDFEPGAGHEEEDDGTTGMSQPLMSDIPASGAQISPVDDFDPFAPNPQAVGEEDWAPPVMSSAPVVSEHGSVGVALGKGQEFADDADIDIGDEFADFEADSVSGQTDDDIGPDMSAPGAFMEQAPEFAQETIPDAETVSVVPAVAEDDEDFGMSAPVHDFDEFDEFETETPAEDAAVVAADHSDVEDENDSADAASEDEGVEPARILAHGTRLPLIDLGPLGFDKLASTFHKRTRAMHNLLKRRYSVYGLDLLPMIDRKCAEWLAKSKTPYKVEIDDIAKKFKAPGVYALNLFFEFGCTSAVAPDPEGGARLLHTLDWPIKGVGHLLVAARKNSEHGAWVNISWPGYVGCLQGLAPRRFAAAINQAPTGTSKQPWMNWLSSKMKWKAARDMPPAFLLRKVFEECKDFDSAVSMLEKTPICFPAIFSIVGVQEGEFAIVERTETDRKTNKRQTAVTNHWLNNEFSGRAIGYKSEDRLVTMKSRLDKGVEHWSWLRAPVLNPTTRMAMDLNPTTGRLRMIGYDGLEPATVPLDIYAD